MSSSLLIGRGLSLLLRYAVLIAPILLLSQSTNTLPPVRESHPFLIPATPSDTIFSRFEAQNAVSPPLADTSGIPDLVPPSMIIAAATLEAEKRWQVFSVGDPIPCSGGDGKLFAFEVPVAIKQPTFPPILTPLPASQVTDETMHLRDLWAADTYWTFVVSAREADFPVPTYHEGLPPFLVTYHKAAAIARQAMSTQYVTLDSYYWLGHRGNFYLFRSISGDTCLINSHSLSIESETNVLTPATQSPGAHPPNPRLTQQDSISLSIYRDQVRQEWNLIRQSLTKK